MINKASHPKVSRKVGVAAVAALCVVGGSVALATSGVLPVRADVNPAQADEASQQQVTIYNTSNEDLTLVSASHSGPGVHWHAQAQPTLKAGTSEVVTDYGAGDNTIAIVYKGATTGTQYSINTYVDFANPEADDSCKATTTPASADTIAPFGVIMTSCGEGDNLHSSFNIAPSTGIVGYTGKGQTYTVPEGYSKLKVTAVGGSGYGTWSNYAQGAQVTGTIDVTPGETFTVGVGQDAQKSIGGWGLPYKGSSFSGGTGVNCNFTSGGGGGATVVLDSNNEPVVVAGGAGGQGNDSADGHGDDYGLGGSAGAGPTNNGSGNDGSPDGLGGKAACSGSTEGQSDDSGGDVSPGAGGGGMEGGCTGLSGNGGGGGAGSSYTSSQVTDPSITTTGAYPTEPDGLHPGWVEIQLSN